MYIDKNISYGNVTITNENCLLLCISYVFLTLISGRIEPYISKQASLNIIKVLVITISISSDE